MRKVLCTMLALLNTVALAQCEDPELLRRTIAQHRAARESIRTLSAEYEYKKVYPKTSMSAAGRYTRTTKSVLITNGTEGVRTAHSLVRDGEVRSLGRSWAKDGTLQFTGGKCSDTKIYSLGEVWVPLLLATEGPQGAMMSHDELYTRAKRPPQASKATLDGRECIKVEVAYDVPGAVTKDQEINLVVWHDVARNFLILRREYRQVGYDILHAFQVVDFQEPAPGVIVPTHSHVKAYNGSRVTNEWDIALRNVQVNTDISEQSLSLPKMPNGTLIYDETTEQQYAVDANWNRVGPAKSMPKMMAQSAVTEGKMFDQPSESEPAGLSHWIILASVAVFAVAVLWFVTRFILRRLRASKNSS